MNQTSVPTDQDPAAPQAYRDALAEFVQVAVRVARMIGHTADAETELAQAASQAGAADGASSMPTSLAEAIEADRAAAAAAEARQTVVARVQAVADAFARVSRSIRLTIALAERLDRGWARGGIVDGRHANALRHIGRGVEDATGREAEGERGVSLTGALTERLESLDTEDELDGRPVEEVFGLICRLLRLDPVRMALSSPLPGNISVAEANEAAPSPGGKRAWEARPPERPPDG